MNQKIQLNSRYFLLTLFSIFLIGIIMVYSSSYIYAKEVFGRSSYFFSRQAFFSSIGVLIAFVLSFSKFSFWEKKFFFLHLVITFFLLLTIIPGVGVGLKGSQRWLSLFWFRLQPGEILKFSVIFPAFFFFEKFNLLEKKERVIYGVALVFPLLVFFLQPDFGTFSIYFFTLCFIAFLSSFSRKYFYSLIGFGGFSLLILLVAAPYRVKRLFSFLDPWKDPKNTGFQVIQSFLAFANGSFWGKGIGNSKEKLFYLPEAYNDFIFSVIGEELGFIGVLIVASLFLTFIYLGFKLALLCRKKSHSLFISGVIFTIAIQAFLNMGVVLGLLPTKGLNLPFISYGGSSAMANFVFIGFLFSALRAEIKKNQELEEGVQLG